VKSLVTLLPRRAGVVGGALRQRRVGFRTCWPIGSERRHRRAGAALSRLRIENIAVSDASVFLRTMRRQRQLGDGLGGEGARMAQGSDRRAKTKALAFTYRDSTNGR
jgi:hypothetical protein